MLKSLLREPLVHFLLLGALLFALDAWLRPGGAPAADTAIVVGEARVRSLSQNFARVWQRPPTRIELEGLVEDHVREEVLVREALVLGLDRDDAIVRRRLRQKMEFVSDETAALAAAHRKGPGRLPGREPRGIQRARSRELRAGLPRPGPARAQARGRREAPARPAEPAGCNGRSGLARRRPAPARGPLRKPAAVRARAAVRRGFRQGAVPAADRHVGRARRVRVRRASGAGRVKQPGGVAALADVRPLVEREWANARRKALGEADYARLRAKYRVEVRMPAAAQSGARP